MLGVASAALSSLVVGFTGLYVAVWLFALLAAITMTIIIAAEVEGIDFKTYSKSIDVIGLCALLPSFGHLGIAGAVAGILILLVIAYIKLQATALKEEFTKYA